MVTKKRIWNFVSLGVFLIIILAFCFIKIPTIYDWFNGRTTIENHISEIIGNETNHEQITLSLLTWLKENVHYPTKEEQKWSFFYNINNKTRIFFRRVPVSWTIKTKLGRCEEDSKYFVEIMDKLGYKSKIIKPVGWDHNWAEYYTKKGKKIIVNPSGFEIIEVPIEFGKKHNWTEIWAFDLNGTKENVSLDYLPSF